MSIGMADRGDATVTITGSHVDGGGGQGQVERAEEWVADKWISEHRQFFKGFAQERKNTATIKRKALIEAQNGGLF